ncbi:hypothetical protein GVAV_000134 [Gurleya vavrai]
MNVPLTFLQTHISYYQDPLLQTPVIEIFGTLPDSTPVCCHLNGFVPYFYVEANTNLSEEFIDKFFNNFNHIYKKAKLLKIEKVMKMSILGYTPSKKEFLKLYFDNPLHFTNIKTFLESGLMINEKKTFFKIYESNVAVVMRFMIDYDITGMCYITLKNYKEFANDYCYSISADINDLSVGSNKLDKLPKLKILSFDIECIGTKDSFPNAKDDPVIQIGNTICYSNSEEIVQKDIFCLKKCGEIPGANVYSFDDESKMLMEWSNYLKEINPDIITGYNIKNFDFPYLLERAEKLKLNEFAYIARKEKAVKAKEQFFSSRQIGSRASKDVDIDGRLIFDMFHVIRKDFNLRSYTLNSVSIHFLGEQKEDVPYSSIKKLQDGDEETRKRIATYCLKDTMLPLKLFFKLKVLANYSEMSRVTGVPVEYLSSRGQAIKVMSQILRRAKTEDYIVPTLDVFDNDRTFEGGFVMEPIKGFYNNPISVLDFSSLYPSIMISNNLCYTTILGKNDKFSIVEDTKENDNCLIRGLGKESIDYCNEENKDVGKIINEESNANKNIRHENNDITNDELGVNLNDEIEDFDTDEEFLEEKEVHENSNLNNDINVNNFTIKRSDIIETPTKNLFVKKTIKLGLLPKILVDLIEERKKAKLELKNTDDEELKASLNARQLALKISANSVYGFTGATTGKLPCLEISQSVTSFGREMIANTKRLIEDTFNIKKGYSHNARVIYGDTDSVMINFKENNLERVFEMSKEISKYVSDRFVKPISLEFEKVYFPYLLMNKKRYAGLVYTNTTTPDKIDTKGIETVRRDNCEMVRDVIETCLDLILFKSDVEKAKDYVKETVRNLYLNKIDLSQLVISKALTKTGEKYSSKQAHVELAEKLKKRDGGNAPVTGDRVGYIIVKGAKGTAAYERSEDPIYVLDNNLPVDTEYYIENQLSKPVFRLFDPIMDNVSDLMKGEHTTSIKSNVPTKGPMSMFAKKQVLCLSCGKAGKILCDKCLDDYPKFYLKFQKELNEKKMIYAKCWTECQRCQGSIKDEVLCVNSDCPIFFMRTKVKKEIYDADTKYKLLRDLDW